ncbi:MAG: hypothetical protein WBC44_20600 [Planctomycetaceae bacterium]
MTGTTFPREQWTNGLALSAFLAMAFGTILLAGCTKQEKVLDVETPGGSIEVYEEKPITE